jgi:hypothetical protein
LIPLVVALIGLVLIVNEAFGFDAYR